MNNKILEKLKQSENNRVRAVAAIAVNTDISFLESEKLLDTMIEEYKNPTKLQKEYEMILKQ